MRCEVMVDGESIGKTTFMSPPFAGSFIDTKKGKARIESVTHTFGDKRLRVDCTLIEPAPPKVKPEPEPVVGPEAESEVAQVPEATVETTEVGAGTDEPETTSHPLRHSTHRRRNR